MLKPIVREVVHNCSNNCFATLLGQGAVSRGQALQACLRKGWNRMAANARSAAKSEIVLNRFKILGFFAITVYCNSLRPPTSSSTCICCIAILFSLTRRSDCGIPSLINTAFRFSIFERQMSSLMVA